MIHSLFFPWKGGGSVEVQFVACRISPKGKKERNPDVHNIMQFSRKYAGNIANSCGRRMVDSPTMAKDSPNSHKMAQDGSRCFQNDPKQSQHSPRWPQDAVQDGASSRNSVQNAWKMAHFSSNVAHDVPKMPCATFHPTWY